jgi:hypothetical protein
MVKCEVRLLLLTSRTNMNFLLTPFHSFSELSLRRGKPVGGVVPDSCLPFSFMIRQSPVQLPNVSFNPGTDPGWAARC